MVARLVKEIAYNVGDLDSRSLGQEDSLEKEMVNPLQNPCLGNPMDRGAWRATVHQVTKVGHNLVTKPPTLPEAILLH